MVKKILIVDDSESIIELMKMVIELENFICVVAYNGEEALDMVRKENPDLILLDIMMPKMDGYQVLIALKKDEKTKKIPVIIISALHQEKNIEKAYKLGADDYIVKGVNPGDLMNRIKDKL